MKIIVTGSILILLSASAFGAGPDSAGKLGPLPSRAKLALDEDWSSGKIDPKRWYALRKKWGQDNFGVVPENVGIVRDTVKGKRQRVLRCEAHGDQYDGPITGQWKRKKRVGGVLVSKRHFASGRFEVVMLGFESFDLGRAVLLEIGAVRLVVSEKRGVCGNHPIVYEHFGIDVAEARMVVVKTASNWQFFQPWISEVVRVDTPGATTSHLEDLPWRHLPRPIYPLDQREER